MFIYCSIAAQCIYDDRLRVLIGGWCAMDSFVVVLHRTYAMLDYTTGQCLYRGQCQRNLQERSYLLTSGVRTDCNSYTKRR